MTFVWLIKAKKWGIPSTIDVNDVNDLNILFHSNSSADNKNCNEKS